MAKSRRTASDYQAPHIVEPEPAEPNCPRCKQTEFAAAPAKVGTSGGTFIYCTSCGCIVGWTSKK